MITAEGGPAVSRRSVARSAAWTAPLIVVGVAAPAFAASRQDCTRVYGAWQKDGRGRTVEYPKSLTFPSSTVTATLAITSTADPIPGGAGTASAKKNHVTGTVVDGQILLAFDKSDEQQFKTITLTVTFSEDVSNLSLLITDIDGDRGYWIDSVVAEPGGFQATRGAYLRGTGISADPWQINLDIAKNKDGDIPSEGEKRDDDTKHHVNLNWPLPVRTIKVVYQAVDNYGPNPGQSAFGQHIGIGQFAFDDC